MDPGIVYFDRSRSVRGACVAGVSLHSHTLHSKESALPLGQFLQESAVAKALIRAVHVASGSAASLDEELSGMWWTPPLTPRQALDVEARQIEDGLGLESLVSISDHDSIDAPMQLQVLGRGEAVPVSVEWSVPYEDTYFHLGIHNLSAATAAADMAQMADYTANPRLQDLPDLLASHHCSLDRLIVLNHPYWDQPVIGAARHERRLEEFLKRFQGWIHALEINGLRDWKENQRTINLSRSSGIPLVSGGDRHGREPNAVLNITAATAFGEFAREVRAGASRLLVMPQYRRPLALRLAENFVDIVSDAPDHGLGWTRWTQRVFRRCEDGGVRSLHELADRRRSPTLKALGFASGVLGSDCFKTALELAMPQPKELL